MEDSTAHHRLIKDSEHSSADVERPQSPQKIETTLALPVESFRKDQYSRRFLITVTLFNCSVLKLHTLATSLLSF